MSIETARIEELGRELGEAIAETPEYDAFEEAKSAVENDRAAQEKIQEFEQQRQEFMLARQVGDASQEDLQDLQRAQQELHALPVMEEYLEAQSRLAERLESVNEAISEPLEVDFGEQVGDCCQE